MRRLKNVSSKALATDTRLRYSIAGVFNTVFGYGLGLGLYTLLRAKWPLLLITGTTATLSIGMSFLSYKLFVFRTSGNWLGELARCYLVYGGGAVAGIISLSILVGGLNIRFWIAQALVNVAMVVWSYFMHRRFTFRA